jgi:hypothetical protein
MKQTVLKQYRYNPVLGSHRVLKQNTNYILPIRYAGKALSLSFLCLSSIGSLSVKNTSGPEQQKKHAGPSGGKKRCGRLAGSLLHYTAIRKGGL